VYSKASPVDEDEDLYEEIHEDRCGGQLKAA
jgi:hypothetical protein